MLAVIWFYWIGVVVVVAAVVAVVATFGGYLAKGQSPKYGRDD
jgi:hypothetical protein